MCHFDYFDKNESLQHWKKQNVEVHFVFLTERSLNIIILLFVNSFITQS